MNLLDQILRHKKQEVEKAKAARPEGELQKRIASIAKPIGFQKALRSGGFGIIGEIKRKSPSMSQMIPANVEEAPGAYEASALIKAVSILTDQKYFGMGIEDLDALKRKIGKPVLRKDFIFDDYQVLEARAFGADAILLMVSVLGKEPLRRLFERSADLGMDVLFECHSLEEIQLLPAQAQICGINSRKFNVGQNSFRYRASRLAGRFKLFGRFGVKDFSTDLDVFKQLIGHLPKSAVKVAESGLSPSGIAAVQELGFDCALIGTSFLKSPMGVGRTIEQFVEVLEARRQQKPASLLDGV
jgi:indole-3-glycerol phosphate synthase